MLNTTRIHRLAGFTATAFLALTGVAAADTVTFSTVGTTTWTVPPDVTSAKFEIVGASGGYDRASGSSCTPGRGAKVDIAEVLTPGETLQLLIGGRGGDASGGRGGTGGIGGGGAGGSVLLSGAAAGGGGGGGQSFVSRPTAGFSAHAGGGGGCGGFADASGGNGGTAGGMDSSAPGSDGSGASSGTAVAGGTVAGGGAGAGTGGAGGSNAPADSHHGGSGTAGFGGDGFGSTDFVAGGGGGGGGDLGGGGGGAAAGNDGSGGGGGAGSSAVDGGGWAYWSGGPAAGPGDGSVTITYTAAAAPAVTTGSARSVTDTAATIVGTVVAQGVLTKYHFEYGPTTSYGQQTPDQSSAAASPMPLIESLGQLTPGTVYHYRVVATNAFGTTDGADATFRTSGPPSVSAGDATAIGETLATLHGTVNPNRHATTYHFEIGTTTSYGQRTADGSAGVDAADQQVSASLTGLTPGTLYHYRLVATNSSGTTDGPDHTLQTAAPPTTGGAGTVSQQPGGSAATAHRTPPTNASGVKAAWSARLSVLGSPRVGRSGVSVTVTCAGADCRVGAVLNARVARRHMLVIGSTRAVLRAGSRRTITIALSAAGRRLQARRVRVPATLVLSLGGTGGVARPVASRQLTLG